MVLIVIGVAAGMILGSLCFGYQGWAEGGFLGALAAIIFEQSKRIGFLESALKLLREDHESARRQLAALKRLSAVPKSDSKSDQADIEKNLSAEIIAESSEQVPVFSEPLSKPETSSAELDSPDKKSIYYLRSSGSQPKAKYYEKRLSLRDYRPADKTRAGSSADETRKIFQPARFLQC